MKNILRFFKNIKTKLIFSFAIILIVPTITIGYLSFLSAKDAIQAEMLDGFSESLGLLNSTIDNTIQPKMNDIGYLAQNISSQSYQKQGLKELIQTFEQYANMHPEVDMVNVGTEKGQFFRKPEVEIKAGYDPRVRDWYKAAMDKKGEIVISPPYVDANTGKMVLTLSQSTKDGSGVVSIDLSLGYIEKLTNQVKIGKHGYALLIDADKQIVSHPTQKGGSKATGNYVDKMYKQETGQFNYTDKHIDKIMSYKTNALTGWKIGGSIDSSEVSQKASPILKHSILIIIIALIIGAVAIYLITKSIISPLKKLKHQALAISGGDLTEVIEIDTNDEIGELAGAFNEMSDNLRHLITEINSSASQVAAASQELFATTDQTTQATNQIASDIQRVAEGAESQVISSEESSLAMEEVSQGMQSIAESSSSVKDSAERTTTLSEQGNELIQKAMLQMESISTATENTTTAIFQLTERSHEIIKIIEVITSIADQTNLLALNAAIEAARAGEHGKGFAVVADEVRKLAEQSRDSATQIVTLINGIKEDTEVANKEMLGSVKEVTLGRKVIDQTGEAFQEISKAIAYVGAQIQEVSATSEQISANTQQVTATIEQLASIAKEASVGSQNVVAASEEQLASIEEISTSTESLSQLAQDLQEMLTKFKI
nr:methyl-accepting chemotaxis protein [Bacillus massilionigeriensis]